MLIPIYPLPGINKSASAYASGKPAGYTGGKSAQGRYIDCDKVRFVAGYPEKIGGWSQVTGLSSIVGIPRSLRAWRVTASDYRLACGTETHLYQYDRTDWHDITPLRTLETGTLTNKLTTVDGSADVAVADSAQTVADGDWVYLSAGTAIGGLTIVGWYHVSGRSGTGYTITAASVATSSVASGGGTITYDYPRTTLTNPFTTTNGSATVTVAHTAHGATTGDYVTFSGASAVGGLTLDGEYQLTVVDANSYTVTASSAASSGASGGGSVDVFYLVTIGQIVTPTAAPYGTGLFGSGPYGYVQVTTQTGVAGWTLAAYGNQMIVSPIGGTIYIYDPVTGGRAYPMLNAPTSVLAMLVTPERFVVALGTSLSSLTMAWCDQTDYTVWTSLPTNTANSGRTKQGGSLFIGGLPVRDGVSLAFSDKSVFQLNYAGDNFVYDTPGVADNAGLIGPFAAVAQGEAAYWMSDYDFWMWNGTVQSLPSDDIRDYVFTNINLTYRAKSFAWLNLAKREVWFNYPSASSTEIDSYVIFHIDQQCWSVGKWNNLSGSGVRTSGVDSTLFSYPIMSDVNGALYLHEIGTDDNGAALAASIEFAPVDVSNGSTNVDVFGFYPDFARLSGSVTLDIQTQLYPQDTPDVATNTIADNDSTPVIDLREDGKMVGYQITSNEIGGDFRFGIPRLDIQPGGARR